MNGSNRVFSYLFYVVCLGLVVFWVIAIDVKEKRLEEQFAAIQQEVLPYEKEIAAIRNDLDEAYVVKITTLLRCLLRFPASASTGFLLDFWGLWYSSEKRLKTSCYILPTRS